MEIGYLLAGLMIVTIGIYDAWRDHYKKNPFISPKYSIARRYLFPLAWVLMGIAMIVSGFYV